jgi:hypothetical protein
MWILVAIIAHTLFAAASVGDKLLFSSAKMKSPAAYAVLVGMLGGLVVLGAVIFGLPWPGMQAAILAAVAGILFVLALFPYYQGIQTYEASRIIPATGGFVPVFSLLFSSLFLSGGASLAATDIAAFILMIGGAVALMWNRRIKFPLASLRISMFASILFAGFFVASKAAYLVQPFWSGLFWSRLGGAIFALLLVAVIPSIRHSLFAPQTSDSAKRSFLLVFGVQIVGAAAGLCESAAVYIAPAAYVPFVNAIQGVQYAILLLLSYALARLAPGIWKEKMAGDSLRIKLAAVASIIVGLYLLSSHV